MTAHPLRAARVGDLLPPSLVDRRRARRLDATAILLPGAQPLDAYRNQVQAASAELAAWDGAVVVEEADGEPEHRLLVIDRYGQVYAVHDADDARTLPDAAELESWFRFLATACPECGVLDDPRERAFTP